MRRALASLEAEGWRLRHSLPWRGGGDIDSVAISPTGIAVAIEHDALVVSIDRVTHVLRVAAGIGRDVRSTDSGSACSQEAADAEMRAFRAQQGRVRVPRDAPRTTEAGAGGVIAFVAKRSRHRRRPG